MYFNEISAPQLSLRIKPEDSNIKLEPGYVQSIKNTIHRGEFELYTKNSVIIVEPINPADANLLLNTIATGRTMLAQLTDPALDGSAELQLVLFNGEQLEMGNIEIGVDEKVQSSLRKHTLDDAAQLLWGQSILQHGGKTYFFIVAGNAASGYLEGQGKKSNTENKTDSENVNQSENPEIENINNDQDEIRDEKQDQNDDNKNEDDNGDNDNTEMNQTPEQAKRRFAILGADIRFALTERDKGNGHTIFLASKITYIRNRTEDPALRLACGNLKFVDWTVAGERAILAKTQLDKLTENDSSYLKKWDEYVNEEGALFLNRARTVGAIPFSIKEENKDGTITVMCKFPSDGYEDTKDILSDVTELDVVTTDNLPEFLNNKNMTYSEFASGFAVDEFVELYLGENKTRKAKTQEKKETITLKVDDFNAATGELRLKADQAPSGTLLIYSVAGEVAQIRRRMQKRTAIQTGRAVNPALGLLIEENGKIPPTQLPPSMKPLTAFVTQKVFPKNPPTMAQKRAIEVALNTPDIALIQGPPGTGKTTVIAAIIERLNEQSDKRRGISGRVLLSGFQHDAVENMIARLTLNGLPVPKFGLRSDDEKNQNISRFERQLQDWCKERVKDLQAKNPHIADSVEEKKLRDKCVQYIQAPTLSLAVMLLKDALKLSTLICEETLRKKLQNELEKLKSEQNNQAPEIQKLAVVRGIRVTEIGFADDGADRALVALNELNDDLDEAGKALLSQASRWLKHDETPPFLKDLKILKGSLRQIFTPPPMFRMEKARDSVIDLIRDTISQIARNGFSARDKKTAALAELLLEMKCNPSGILDAIKDYCYAFAATCQQSVNKQMQKMKGIKSNSLNQTMEYDFVIVDEAARVSPLDLMIPMAQGKRIILVGDHRQLPQLINEEVAKRLEKESETRGETDWLKISMFEHLFTKRLKQLEESDSIQRRVTLDKQFRMHPLLGDFISRNFYEHFNDMEKFTSGLPEEEFRYDLPETEGKCAIWMQVPLNRGRMEKSGTSQIRPGEADAICQKLKEWIEYDNNRTNDPKKRLTFGVIAFYKAQAELIKKKLGDKFTNSVNEERLRIGTVDSFQGMEFDVVFLSLVRTGTQGFGFLQLYNRLNVSMSRQKKLLVAVGDADFYNTSAAKEKVPGLADFLKLCNEKGKIL